MPASRLRSSALALLAGAALVLSGCAATGEPLDDVITGQWTLASATQGGGQLNFAGTTVTLSADAQGFDGSAPCNLYGAAIAGDTANLQVLSLVPGEVECDATLTSLESAYFSLLSGATSAAREGGQLVLSGDDGELRFDASGWPLVGTTWTLQTLTAQGAEVPIAPDADGAAPTLRLGPDGRTSGSTGCRDIALDYAIANGEVEFDGFPSEAPECSAETAAQDDLLFTLLGFGFASEISGDTLTVQNSEFGLVAAFTASQPGVIRP